MLFKLKKRSLSLSIYTYIHGPIDKARPWRVCNDVILFLFEFIQSDKSFNQLKTVSTFMHLVLLIAATF
jgi:hypothetical protein